MSQKCMRTRRLSHSGNNGKGAYVGVPQAGMDDKLDTGTSGGHGASWPPCHGYGTGGERLRVGTVNVGTLRGREGEVVDMVDRRGLDFCCLQESRWKGGGAREMGEYKCFWSGDKEGAGGVAVLVARKWQEEVTEVKRVSERIMLIRIRVGKRILCLVSVYAPQAGRAMVDKEEFYDALGEVLKGVKEEEALFICGDFNGHVGGEADGYEGIHGCHGFGRRNLEGELLLEFAEARELVVANTWFKKKEKQIVTYVSGGTRSMIDYILVRKRDMRMLTDATVIPNEPCIPQHRLLFCSVKWKEKVRKVKKMFVSKCRLWKLREAENEMAFKMRVEEKEALRPEGDVEQIWDGLKQCMVKEAEAVCGRSKGPPRHRETWWWNDKVKEVVERKRSLFLAWKNCEPGEKETNRKAYKEANKQAKRVIYKAKDDHRQEFVEELEREEAKGNLFGVVKRMASRNKDVVGGGGVKDKEGKVQVENSKMLEVWREYYEKLLNEEFIWRRSDMETLDPKEGPCEQFTMEEVRDAIHLAKNGKATGPSEVASEMLKCSGDAGVRWVTDLCNVIIRDGVIPKDWRKSWMLSIYKGKGDVLDCGSHRGIKLIDHVMKVLERLVERRVKSKVALDSMQFGFTAGKGTTDAIFIVRQVQEKHLAKKRELWMAFVDLEKAFDRVPREVVWWALRRVGVEEWLVKVIQSMYVGVTTAVRMKGEESKEFEVKVGVHQGSVLSPLLFTIVLEALSRQFRNGLPWELFYADDLVLLAESREILMERISVWKEGLESKGLRVNVGKTKVMKCHVAANMQVVTGKYPCGVCGKGVGRNSIYCKGCKKWIHRKCSGVKGKLKEDSGYSCAKCVGGRSAEGGVDEQVVVLGDGSSLECTNRFCYLGDMLGAAGGCGEASRTRVRAAWGQFHEFASLLTRRGTPLKQKGRIYRTCVQSVMVYASETWAVRVEEEQRMQRNENVMLRWMCGVTLKDKVPTVELRKRLGIEGVVEVMRRGRLRWFGHVERKTDG